MQSTENLLPGIPAFDSPFFDRPGFGHQIRPENLAIAEALRETGYAVIDFPDPDFTERAASIRNALNDTFDWAEWRDRGGFERNEGLRVQDAWRTNSDVKAIAMNPAILALLSDLYGRRAKPFQTLNFPVGTQQRVHSDESHFASMPAKFMCGVWVALEDIDSDAGPLFYYPGTQNWPSFQNEHFGVTAHGGGSTAKYGLVWDALLAAHQSKPERFLARKGQALIWVSSILHGGDRQLDKAKTRWSQVTHYFFEDCAYYTPFHTDPFHGSIQYRQPTDIGTGEPMTNVVGGRSVDPRFVEEAAGRARQMREGQSLVFEDRIAALEAKLQEQIDRNERLKSSLSWRITAPLRRIGRS
ncbi:phytanoyl-CoA dioxygenase family protein [Methylobacterium sp. C25]|uniref:phytanoyl-CoA dioxygenase family protein n=1 Tax=Methylobacterium sp. C25 TaxID=2721622 RepID=UPI001F22E146|nr:phytanoyl-CoA dioxygenase family protein [Methylobacterium sp. C25]MCE4223162.1 phytanoyl-CoA dioxygenase family protein [Methylobacterium sp. C25]